MLELRKTVGKMVADIQELKEAYEKQASGIRILNNRLTDVASDRDPVIRNEQIKVLQDVTEKHNNQILVMQNLLNDLSSDKFIEIVDCDQLKELYIDYSKIGGKYEDLAFRFNTSASKICKTINGDNYDIEFRAELKSFFTKKLKEAELQNA